MNCLAFFSLFDPKVFTLILAIAAIYAGLVLWRALRPRQWGSEVRSLIREALSYKDFDKGHPLLKSQLDARPDDPETWHALTFWLDSQGRSDLAEPLLHRAVARWPADSHFASELAWVSTVRNPYSAATTELIEKAEKAGAHPEVLQDTRAWRLYLLGRYGEAWDALQGPLKLAD